MMSDNKEPVPNNKDTTDAKLETANSEEDNGHQVSKDEPDPRNFFWLPNKKKQDEETAKMPVERDALFYKMTHKNRGIAVIFNHEQFTVPTLKQRNGTQVDKKSLEDNLWNLGFEVWSFTDLEFCDVLKTVERAAKDYDHSDNDCFVLAVLSHGEKDILYAKDLPYDPQLLWAPFTGDQCKSLAGKPKLFFIQACQGDSLDRGIELRQITEHDSCKSYRIPIHADFLVAFSTVPGYYSWRNTTKGSWFIQALCEVLQKYAYNWDLLTILTLVLQRVAVDYESNVPGNPTMHNQKQMPYITTTLTRLVAFKPKDLNIGT